MTAPTSAPRVTLTSLPPALSEPKTHHVGGNPPTSFANPWPSFSHNPSLSSLFSTRFGRNRTFVPVPESRDELVSVQKPDWGVDHPEALRATWLGHAGFLVETASAGGKGRGVRILFDAVFAERVGPYGMVGPRRFTPAPCTMEELPEEIDLVAISHNHYDHLDIETIRFLARRNQKRGKGEGNRTRFLTALGGRAWYLGLGAGIEEEDVVEMDWWDQLEVTVEGVGRVRTACTPAQHASGRGVWDHGKTLWCSWVVQEMPYPASSASSPTAGQNKEKDSDRPLRTLFFAGDTGYRTITSDSDAKENPGCPAFPQIGTTFGPISLSLLPIGCFKPRAFMSGVHCAPEDSIEIHKAVRSKKSIGMHYGSIRGGLSAQYEDVREPPRQWREVAEKEGLEWGREVGCCAVGETVIVV
ncbi:MAG: hypothetical protein Q9160_001471 [Pyrenula sp. 1 TL-2023]